MLRVESESLTCAGRTDTGVHARGQVVHLDVADPALAGLGSRGTASPVDALVRRLNGVMSDDVRILAAAEVPPAFDARFSALWRRYAYRIADAPRLVDPLSRGSVLAWPRPLDLDAMNEAVSVLVGEHDFAAFCRKREGATRIRTLLDLSWSRDHHGLAVARVRADAFCHTMVRSLVGCLIAVGDGRRGPSWAGEVLARGVRDGAVTVVRPHGLTLEEVSYPPDDQLASRAESARTMRTMPGPGTRSDG